MLSVRACKTLFPVLVLAGAFASLPAFATRTHRAATSVHSRTAKKKTASSHQIHGQRQIDSARATEIQSALIREHYLSGSPTGAWDAESQAAMTKFQADQGWQTKITPDSRALIKLGLGPNQESGKLQPGDQASLPSTNASVPHGASGSNSLLGASSVSQ